MLLLPSICLVNSNNSSEVRLLLWRADRSFCSSGTICGILSFSPFASIIDSSSVGETACGGNLNKQYTEMSTRKISSKVLN